jgi:putative heme-binding domain-containing protein
MVRLLRGGTIPPERQATVLGMVAKRGGPADLRFVLDRAIDPAGFPGEVRARALEALAEAARNRKARPEGDTAGIAALALDVALAEDVRGPAIELAGLWQAAGVVPAFCEEAARADTTETIRSRLVEALATIDVDEARNALESLAGPTRPWPVRARAVGGLARRDPARAAELAAGLLAEATAADPIGPLLAAFLAQKEGPERMAAAVEASGLPADAAKLALRSVYALGRSDPPLVAALNRAAGLDAEAAPPSEAEIAALVAEVEAKGDAARGEVVFRRADLSCLSCHAVAGAGGAVGPDLSAIGSSSPIDYLVRSLAEPSQSIKEQYQTLVASTVDGQIHQGIVVDRDDQRVLLRQADGSVRSVPAADIEEERAGESLMPKGLTSLVTRAELVDLLRFLSELGKAGPYAIGPATHVRRWRVLRDVAAVRPGVDPSDETVRGILLALPEERWSAAYARVSGALPLGEVRATAGGDLVYLTAELDVASAGPARLVLDDPEGVRLWVDGRALVGDGDAALAELESGRHRLLVRVDLKRRTTRELSVRVVPAEGSSVRVTPVGGS